jgi:hypothetical protein
MLFLGLFRAGRGGLWRIVVMMAIVMRDGLGDLFGRESAVVFVVQDISWHSGLWCCCLNGFH